MKDVKQTGIGEEEKLEIKEERVIKFVYK